jgi:hypothetical protein
VEKVQETIHLSYPRSGSETLLPLEIVSEECKHNPLPILTTHREGTSYWTAERHLSRTDFLLGVKKVNFLNLSESGTQSFRRCSEDV